MATDGFTTEADVEAFDCLGATAVFCAPRGSRDMGGQACPGRPESDHARERERPGSRTSSGGPVSRPRPSWAVADDTYRIRRGRTGFLGSAGRHQVGRRARLRMEHAQACRHWLPQGPSRRQAVPRAGSRGGGGHDDLPRRHARASRRLPLRRHRPCYGFTETAAPRRRAAVLAISNAEPSTGALSLAC